MSNIEHADDPLVESRLFIGTFLNDLNAKYGTMLTLEEAYTVVKDRIHSLELSQEIEVGLLLAIEAIISDPLLSTAPTIPPTIQGSLGTVLLGGSPCKKILEALNRPVLIERA